MTNKIVPFYVNCKLLTDSEMEKLHKLTLKYFKEYERPNTSIDNPNSVLIVDHNTWNYYGIDKNQNTMFFHDPVDYHEDSLYLPYTEVITMLQQQEVALPEVNSTVTFNGGEWKINYYNEDKTEVVLTPILKGGKKGNLEIFDVKELSNFIEDSEFEVFKTRFCNLDFDIDKLVQKLIDNNITLD